MSKYWIVGTSTKKYINNYIEIIKKAEVSEKISIDMSDKSRITLNNENDDTLFIFKSDTTYKQCLCAWESLGLVKLKQNGIVLLMSFFNLTEGYDLTKYHLLKKDDDNSINKYRFSKLINILFQAKWISMSDINNMGIKQTRGNLNSEKIENEIGEFEKHISKDEFYLKRVMEVLDDYKF